jgi:hypothetical protein
VSGDPIECICLVVGKEKMDKYTKVALTVIALVVGVGAYIDHTYGIRKHPPHIGHYERIAMWGEDYMEVFDSRPPAYAVIYVPVRSYR